MTKNEKILKRALEMAVIEIRTIGCCALCCAREDCSGYSQMNFKQCDKKLSSHFTLKAKEELK